MPYPLDFNNLPPVKFSSWFKGLDSDVEAKIKKLNMSETYGRLCASALFFSECHSAMEDWLVRAYIRTGLSEFRSVTEALRWDSGEQKVHRLTDSTNPLIHLMFLLRRINVYKAPPALGKTETTTVSKTFGEELEHTYDIIIIDKLEEYLRVENRLEKSYKTSDISRVCEWFTEMQIRFGAPVLFVKGVSAYCIELSKVYSKSDDENA